MDIKIKPKEAASIIKALEGGVVPEKGLAHLQVGRSREVDEVLRVLNGVIDGESDLKFWVGDFGTGKSFMLRTIEIFALNMDFIVSTVDLNPERRFYASDGKAKALYTEIITRLASKTSGDGNTLKMILEKWILSIIREISSETGLSSKEIMSKENQGLVKERILKKTSEFYSKGMAFELGQAAGKYFEGMANGNSELSVQALRWIMGEIDTKTESRTVLGIRDTITDDNWFLMIKNLAELFKTMGYSGFVINFDEMVNIYKLPMAATRERNYEKILNIYNECKTNVAKYLLINFGATRKTVYDERRGMSGYGALKGRLGTDVIYSEGIVNSMKTVMDLKPLSPEEIYTLLERLWKVYEAFYKTTIPLTHGDIEYYMVEQLNRPGAREFLTPRAVIKDFIEILDLSRQNPDRTIRELTGMKLGVNTEVKKDSDDLDDIEIL